MAIITEQVFRQLRNLLRNNLEDPAGRGTERTDLKNGDATTTDFTFDNTTVNCVKAYLRSATSKDGTITGASWDTSNQKWGSACLDFDSLGDTVQLTPLTSDLQFDGNDSFTWEAWFNPTLSANGVLMELSSTTSSRSIFVGLNDSGAAVEPHFVMIDDAAQTIFVSAGNHSKNTWHHLAVVWDGTTHTGSIYIDGVFQASQTNVALTGDLYDANSLVNIGEWVAVPTKFYDGLFDSTKISNVAKTSFDIYNPLAYDTNTVLLWNMNEGTGSAVYDYTAWTEQLYFRDYTVDFGNSSTAAAISFTTAPPSGTNNIRLDYTTGKTWIYPDAPRVDSKMPRISLQLISGTSFPTSLANNTEWYKPTYQIGVWSRSTDNRTIGGETYSGSRLRDYLTSEILQIIQDNKNSMHNILTIENVGVRNIDIDNDKELLRSALDFTVTCKWVR